uniref:Reverse transcriptase domain-containing protein n=1 Tax=Graphocephala atropunctata TaxID=36148 RepID=A0A1B6LSC1_9HEMI
MDRLALREDWSCAKSVFSYQKVAWAIRSFQPYKSPGVDGIIPAMLQESVDLVVPKLLSLFRTSLATGVIPSAWKTSRVIFIPKPGRTSYDRAKDYRPISLTSFLLKTMEKVIDRHVRVNVLGNCPLHTNQHAYQQGKSCETALHNLVGIIEQAIACKEIALAVFLDIEGAFDNTSTGSIVSKLVSRNTEETIVRWVNNMLSDRRVQASLCGVIKEVKAQKGCRQGGVLSPSLWNLVVDDLLVTLNAQGLYAQGYADDIVIVIRGKYMDTCLGLMKRAMSIVEQWCITEGLSVNPTKTVMVPFTNQRNAEIETAPKLFGGDILVAKEFKYLGVRLDQKLTWNSHLKSIASRSQTALAMMGRAVGSTWGLNPNMVNWLYTRVVRPMMVYGSVVWWPKVAQKTAVKILSKVQRSACLAITGAMRGTAALEVVLSLPPLEVFTRGEARMAA